MLAFQKKRRLFKSLVSRYPAVLVTGPRSREREHVIRHFFPEKSFIDLSSKAVYNLAKQSPRTFLLAFPDGAIINDLSLLPPMVEAVRHYVEKANTMKGKWILLSSPDIFSHLSAEDPMILRDRGLAVVNLSGLCVEELEAENLQTSNPFQIMQTGQIIDLLEPNCSKHDFIDTIIDRDVLRFINQSNREQFMAFMKVCAPYSSMPMSMNSIAKEASTSAPTAKSWLGIMEKAGLIRMIDDGENPRSARFFFTDTGIMCHLLGIENMQGIILGGYKEAIVRTYAFNELVRGRDNRQLRHNIRLGRKCDLTTAWRQPYSIVIEPNVEVTEENLRRAREIKTGTAKTVILHLGDVTYTNAGIDCISYRDWEKFAEELDYFS